jgi:hypothetical protein
MNNLNDPPIITIIGVELRLKTLDGYQEEMAMLSCNITLPNSANPAYPYCINGTIHTSLGDINFGNQERLQIPVGYSRITPHRDY